MEDILNVKSVFKTWYDRIHKNYMVRWNEHRSSTSIGEADLNCRSQLQEIDKDRLSRNLFEVMQSHEVEIGGQGNGNN